MYNEYLKDEHRPVATIGNVIRMLFSLWLACLLWSFLLMFISLVVGFGSHWLILIHPSLPCLLGAATVSMVCCSEYKVVESRWGTPRDWVNNSIAYSGTIFSLTVLAPSPGRFCPQDYPLGVYAFE